MAFHIAAVSFLNTVPLVELLAASSRADVVLVKDLPSRLPALLASGEADAALVPVVELFRGCGGGFMSGIAIACEGPVGSVKLFVNGLPEDVRLVHADRGSRTSVALTRVLLAERYGVRPSIEEIVPEPGVLPAPGEATLVIGDRCFAYEATLAETGVHDIVAVDLGAWWWDRTALPFVFAVWALSKSFLADSEPERVAELKELLTTARDYGLDHVDDLATAAAARGQMGIGGKATPAAIAYYFRESLRFSLGEKEMAGIRLFHELCVRHDIIPAGEIPPAL